MLNRSVRIDSFSMDFIGYDPHYSVVDEATKLRYYYPYLYRFRMRGKVFMLNSGSTAGSSYILEEGDSDGSDDLIVEDPTGDIEPDPMSPIDSMSIRFNFSGANGYESIPANNYTSFSVNADGTFDVDQIVRLSQFGDRVFATG